MTGLLQVFQESQEDGQNQVQGAGLNCRCAYTHAGPYKFTEWVADYAN